MDATDRSSGVVPFTLATSGGLYAATWIVGEDDIVVNTGTSLNKSEPQIRAPTAPPGVHTIKAIP